MRQLLAASLLLAFATLISAATPREEILGTVTTVGLMPVELPSDLPGKQAKTDALEALITAKLTEAGLTVVPPSRFVAIRDRLKREAGGWIDPITGHADADKRKRVIEAARAEYASSTSIQAYVFAAVEVMTVSFSGGTASWHGARENVSGKQGAAAAFHDFMALGGGQGGRLGALSLGLGVESLEGKPLYSRYGGLQLITLNIGSDFVDVDPEYLVSDPVRNERAVKLALRPLLYSPAQIKQQDEAEKAAAAAASKTDAPSVPVKPAKVRLSAETAPAPPLRVAAEKFVTHANIVLAPLENGTGRKLPDVAGRYELLLSRTLAERHYSVVPSSALVEARNKAEQAVGGMYDPLTGEVIEEKRVAIWKATLRELAQTGEVGAVLFPAMTLSEAAFAGGSAAWDGVREPIDAKQRSKLARVLGPPDTSRGEVGALALEIRLLDADQTLLYEKRGGIQLLNKYQGTRIAPVADDQLFVDAANDERAVNIALAELPRQP